MHSPDELNYDSLRQKKKKPRMEEIEGILKINQFKLNPTFINE